MKPFTIQAENFMSFDRLDLEFPDRGIVLVTGDNGQGKSSIVESIAVAGWGKTLRGTPWFREKKKSVIKGVFAEATITRTRTKGGRNILELGGSEQEHDNASKAAEQLEALIPSFEMWRRTCVFTSAAVEGLHFASEKDSERKRALEETLGIDQFDEALEALRADQRALEEEIRKAERRAEIASEKATSEERRSKEAVEQRQRLSKLRPPAAKPPNPQPLIQELHACKREESIIMSSLADKNADAAQAKKRLDKISASACPTCTQKIPDELRATFLEEHHEAQGELAQALAESKRDLEGIREQIEELSETINDMLARKRTAEKAWASFKQMKADRDAVEETIKNAIFANTRNLNEAINSRHAAGQARKKLALLEKAESVLGLRGVRAHIIANALGGLSAVANQWLAKMDVPINVKISPYTEKVKGGSSDVISIAIEGAGAGHGYRACSAGQRRVVDVANIFALATMFQHAQGHGGTLWLDEVFDVLDPEYAKGVASALDEIARERCVVIISHGAPILRELDPVARWRVQGGKVVES